MMPQREAPVDGAAGTRVEFPSMTKPATTTTPTGHAGAPVPAAGPGVQEIFEVLRRHDANPAAVLAHDSALPQ